MTFGRLTPALSWVQRCLNQLRVLKEVVGILCTVTWRISGARFCRRKLGEVSLG